jgi:microsomal dipeptidase-like Zn-dependent dipeptidase
MLSYTRTITPHVEIEFRIYSKRMISLMRFIDLHAHYPMHLGLPRCPEDDPILKLSREALFALANEVDNFEAVNRPRVTPEYVRKGGVSGFASVLYDPEDEFLVEQRPGADAFPHIIKLLENVEADASAHGIKVATDPSTLDRCLETGEPFLVHCMEGGHGLSGNPGNVDKLSSRGVAYITLAHLRYMGLAGCAKGLPCKTDFWQKLINSGQDPDVGLTDLGHQVLDAILDSRLVLDITHCSNPSRADIFRRYRASHCKRPVISSHTGVQALSNYELNLDDETLGFIGETGGLVGVILFPFWLSDHNSGQSGIDQLCSTIDYVRKKIGNSSVAIGTDLDGFIQPIHECRNYSQVAMLIRLLFQRYEKDPDPDFVEKLLWKNARQVILEAWG